jgi:hypothetical protein
MGNVCAGPAPAGETAPETTPAVTPAATPAPDASAPTETSVAAPKDTTVPEGLVIEVSEVRPAMVPINRQKSIKRQVTITLKPVDVMDEEDIEIISRGAHYLIRGTKVLIDITTCQIIGYLDEADKAVLECNDYVRGMCEKYEMEFQTKGCF